MKDKALFKAWVLNSSPLLAQAVVVMETIATGLAMLASQFPENVDFELIGGEEEEDDGDRV